MVVFDKTLLKLSRLLLLAPVQVNFILHTGNLIPLEIYYFAKKPAMLFATLVDVSQIFTTIQFYIYLFLVRID